MGPLKTPKGLRGSRSAPSAGNRGRRIHRRERRQSGCAAAQTSASKAAQIVAPVACPWRVSAGDTPRAIDVDRIGAPSAAELQRAASEQLPYRFEFAATRAI